MKLVGAQRHKSIEQGVVTGVDLPEFTVLTGPNGSGKSNLLEALQSNAVFFEDLGALPPDQVRLFVLGQLLAAAEGPVQGANYREPWANLYNTVSSLKQQAPNSVGAGASPEQTENWVASQVIANKLTTRAGLDRMVREADKHLIDFEVRDFELYAPALPGVKDPFAASIAEVFLTYTQRKIHNDMAQWRLATKKQGSALSDEEFAGRFGPYPWDLLDETLRLVGLPYRFVAPPEMELANYEVTLLNEAAESIRPADLSSGERVLLAVAMSLFTGRRMSESVELPKLLLLDEADASLHPSMVNSLLTVLEDIFVAQYGVRVILSTHSPSTVALAPPESLHVMSRTGIKLRKASTDEALQLLTVGISSLSVKLENRRQVFVESEHDQAIYQDLFALLKNRLTTERSAEFVAAGRREIGGGCEMVKHLVTELRRGGNTTVFGIIDRDNREQAPPYVHFVSDRHSIENTLLDPLLLGGFLLREQVLTAEKLGLPTGTRHFELSKTHADALVDSLSAALNFTGVRVDVEYSGLFKVSIPEPFLAMRGHDLEALVISTFPPLNRFQSNLKREIVKRAVADLPDFVPLSVIQLFEALLS